MPKFRDDLLAKSEQYSLVKFILRFGQGDAPRKQLTCYSRDFESERKLFLPGLDRATRRHWLGLLNAEEIRLQPELYDLLRGFRPHYVAAENTLVIFYPPAARQAFAVAWEEHQEAFNEALHALNLDQFSPRELDPVRHERQIRLLAHSVQHEGWRHLNVFRQLHVRYGADVRDGKILGIDLFDNLDYSPDNHLRTLTVEDFPALLSPAAERPRRQEPKPIGRVVDDAFRRAG